MKRVLVIWSLVIVLTLTLLTGCVGAVPVDPDLSTTPLSANDINLIFVVTPDLAYSTPGDINPDTANLTNQGLQRSLLMATYLKKQVLGGKNVNRIYTLEPMTHLQTTNKYRDMAAIGFIQQFALLNQIALTDMGGYGSPIRIYNTYPLSASYEAGSVPAGVATPMTVCPGCQGLDFNDTHSSNEALISALLGFNNPGFFVFSAPWETTSALLTNINMKLGYNLSLPAGFTGTNTIYAIAIKSPGKASLVTYKSDLNPPSTYPELPSPVPGASCTAQKSFNFAATGGVNGVIVPPGANTNETVYMIRHAEAHPSNGWEDGNIVAAGQWRALALPNALRGKINPTEIWSIDPAQMATKGNSSFSYVRPSLTVESYAIANNLPYYLVSDLEIFDSKSPQATSVKFFTGGAFSNKTIMLAWEHNQFPPIVTALMASYFLANKAPKVPAWPSEDYDTIWTVMLDAQGNLKVHNALCEGIDSSKLPVTAPPY